MEEDDQEAVLPFVGRVTARLPALHGTILAPSLAMTPQSPLFLSTLVHSPTNYVIPYVNMVCDVINCLQMIYCVYVMFD